jgi:hypothetical protein
MSACFPAHNAAREGRSEALQLSVDWMVAAQDGRDAESLIPSIASRQAQRLARHLGLIDEWSAQFLTAFVSEVLQQQHDAMRIEHWLRQQTAECLERAATN